MAVNVINYNKEITSPLVTETSSRNKNLQRVLLATSAACAILSVIPPFRVAGCLALRGASLLSALTNPSQAKQGGHLLKVLKITAIVVGLIGLAASTPMLLIASIAADMAFQIFEGIKALCNGEMKKASFHFGILVIDTLALAGMLAGSWQLMVSATAISAAALFVFGIGAATSKNYDTALALLALSGASAGATYFNSEIIIPGRTVDTIARPPALPWPAPQIPPISVPVDIPPIVLNAPIDPALVGVGGSAIASVEANLNRF